MSGAGDHKGRPYEFVMEFRGLGIWSLEGCLQTPWVDLYVW